MQPGLGERRRRPRFHVAETIAASKPASREMSTWACAKLRDCCASAGAMRARISKKNSVTVPILRSAITATFAPAPTAG